MEGAWLSGLNPAQRTAVTSTASILQVLAPPGSGKTKTLTSRVAYLLGHYGYQPQNVICCTFTIKASREMRERLRGLVGCELESQVVLGTFHSICRRYLASYGNLIGIAKSFGIADTSDSSNIIKRIVKRLGLAIDPKAARSRISHHKAQGKRLEDLPKAPQRQIEQQEFIAVFHEYEAALATSNMLDYDDLLLRCVDLLRAYPSCVSNVEALLIDEFQDTNIVQFELMKLFASARQRITIVGDPDQSIYGFRSAEIENLRRMKAFYPQTVVINLEENYRSCSAVLKLAQDVIEQDTSRPEKRLKATHCQGTLPVLRRLPNPHEESLWIASEIKRMTGVTGGLLLHSDFAILLRSAYLSLLIERALANSGIPYRMVGGQRFFDRVEIRILVDYLRTISHPDNNPALLAIINVPPRKIGETTIAELVKLGETQKLSLWAVVQKVLAGSLALEKKLTKPAEQELCKLVVLIKRARQKMTSMIPGQVPRQLVEFVVSSLDFQGYLKRKYKEDHEDRLENVKELVNHAADVALQPLVDDRLATIDGLEQQTIQGGQDVLAQFLANIVLSAEVESSDKVDDKPRVTISTIHSAKGLEWPVVFVPDVYQGSIPHSRAEDTDEERRLLYVAMTRAQALLTLTFPVCQSREQGESVLSQFLPSHIHRRLAPAGPLFGDDVIADIASILHRPVPPQEDLARSLLALSGRDSTADDVWPIDGSHRKNTFQLSRDCRPQEGGGKPLSHTPGGGVVTEQRGVCSTMAQTQYSTSSGFSTTLRNQNTYSMSALPLSFTTASHHLQSAKLIHGRLSEDLTLSQKAKPKTSSSSSGSGQIATIFSNSHSRESRPTDGALQWGQTSKAKDSEPGLRSMHGHLDTSSIPSELSSHKIGLNIKKRPRPALEEKSPNRKRYVFLSSSPSREVEEKDECATATLEENLSGKAKDSSRVDSALTNAIIGMPDLTRPRPAATMHKTTMSIIQQQNGYGTGRKTLGLRRTMNGWESRKYK